LIRPRLAGFEVTGDSLTMQCIQCHGNRIETGALKGAHENDTVFTPSGLKSRLGRPRGIPIESFACLDCGFVWSLVVPKELEDFIRNHRVQKIDEPKA
jgi:hypothetical protein